MRLVDYIVYVIFTTNTFVRLLIDLEQILKQLIDPERRVKRRPLLVALESQLLSSEHSCTAASQE